jgi:hypothetical protein
MADRLRAEALLILDGRGAILDVAREVSEILRSERLEGAIIGGVAVVLHGHVRTTLDVDVYTPRADRLAEVLEAHGFTFEKEQRQFVKSGVPVHMVTLEQLELPPQSREEREGILTVSLADLINIKLRTGTTDPRRAQDLADVIGLITSNQLGAEFTPQVRQELRAEFRSLVHAVERGDDTR